MQLVAFIAAALVGAAPSPSPSPAPSPSPIPTASPAPAVAVHAVFGATEAFTSGVNATGSFDTPSRADRANRFNVSNAFAIVTKSDGTLQFAFQGGAYSIPTIGVAGNRTIQANANTGLFGPVPLAYVEYAPSVAFNASAGILASLTGAESTFTYQNWNIQRGAVWNVENAVTRGFRAGFVRGKAVVTLGADDGFYSGSYGAAEASIVYAPDPNASVSLVWLDPNRSTPPNPTAAVANKELFNVVFVRTRGAFQLAPYLLWARSPSSPSLGYVKDERTFGAAVLANLTITNTISAAARWESLRQGSSPADTGGNIDLVGYGAGSGITTWTITPAWKVGHAASLRVDLSHARVSGAAPGLAFGLDGRRNDQARVVIEVSAQL